MLASWSFKSKFIFAAAINGSQVYDSKTQQKIWPGKKYVFTMKVLIYVVQNDYYFSHFNKLIINKM